MGVSRLGLCATLEDAELELPDSDGDEAGGDARAVCSGAGDGSLGALAGADEANEGCWRKTCCADGRSWLAAAARCFTCGLTGTASVTPAAWRTRWASSQAGSESDVPQSLDGGLPAEDCGSSIGDRDAPEDEDEEVKLRRRPVLGSMCPLVGHAELSKVYMRSWFCGSELP